MSTRLLHVLRLPFFSFFGWHFKSPFKNSLSTHSNIFNLECFALKSINMLWPMWSGLFSPLFLCLSLLCLMVLVVQVQLTPLSHQLSREGARLMSVDHCFCQSLSCPLLSVERSACLFGSLLLLTCRPGFAYACVCVCMCVFFLQPHLCKLF